MIKISVVIPTYNSSAYLEDALDSVLTQTRAVSEVIVVDDGSIDDTKKIVGNYVAIYPDRVKYFYQKNKGPAAARNKGIEEACGNYIAFLDSDDVWLPEKIEKQTLLFKNHDYAMVYCDMKHEVDGRIVFNSYLKEKNYKLFGSGSLYNSLLKENFIFTPTVIVKKEVFEDIGYFDEAYRICEDYHMWLRIAKHYKIGFLNEPLVVRKRHNSNITEDKYLYLNSGIKLFEELIRANSHDREAKRFIEEGLHERFFNLGYYFWDKARFPLARENFLKAISYKKTDLKAASYFALSHLPGHVIGLIRSSKDV